MNLYLAGYYPDSIDRSPSKAKDMKLMLRKPHAETIRLFLDAQTKLAFTCSPVGATTSQPPSGYDLDRARINVGEAGVLLAFLAEATLKGDHLPPHGASGPGHFALGIEAESLDSWRKHLQGHGVTFEKEVAWPKGGKSLYFRDPAGNSVELVTPKVWGLPSGW